MLLLCSSILLLSSCTTISLLSGRSLTDAQLQAIEDAGLDGYFCITVTGPAFGGQATIIGLPKGATPGFRFGTNCQIIEVKL